MRLETGRRGRLRGLRGSGRYRIRLTDLVPANGILRLGRERVRMFPCKSQRRDQGISESMTPPCFQMVAKQGGVIDYLVKIPQKFSPAALTKENGCETRGGSSTPISPHSYNNLLLLLNNLHLEYADAFRHTVC